MFITCPGVDRRTDDPHVSSFTSNDDRFTGVPSVKEDHSSFRGFRNYFCLRAIRFLIWQARSALFLRQFTSPPFSVENRFCFFLFFFSFPVLCDTLLRNDRFATILHMYKRPNFTTTRRRNYSRRNRHCRNSIRKIRRRRRR